MNEQEKAHYEEWKRKCAETRARKKRELVEERAKLLKEKPGYRIPTRGSNKGKLVWMGYRQEQIDKNMARNAEKRQEALAKRAIEAANNPTDLAMKVTPPELKRDKVRPYELILAYVFVCGITLTYMFIAKSIAHLGILGLAIFIDVLLYQLFAKKSCGSRYAPFVWWFLMQRR